MKIFVSLLLFLTLGVTKNSAQYFRSYDVNQSGDFGRILFDIDSMILFISRTSCFDTTSCGFIGYLDRQSGDVEFESLLLTDGELTRPNGSHVSVKSDDRIYIATHDGGESSNLNLIIWDIDKRKVDTFFTYNEIGRTLNLGMVQTSDNSLVALQFNEQTDGSGQYRIYKIDLNGEIVWKSNLDSISINRIENLSPTLDSGFVVAYQYNVGGLPGFTNRFAKYDKNGVYEYNTEVSRTISFSSVVVECNSFGNIFMSSEYSNPRDIWDIRIDLTLLNKEGEVLEDFHLTRLGFEVFDILELNDGNYLLSGVGSYTDEEGDNWRVGWVFKYSIDEGVLWERLFTETDLGFQGSIFYNSLELDDGSLMLIGRNFAEVPNTDPPQRNQNTLIVKLDSMGCLQPDCGEVQVITALDNLASPAPSYDALFYPNPTTGEIFIQNFYDWKGARYIIYDLQGAQMSHGIIDTETIQLQADLPDGLYIIQLMDEDKRYAERVVLQR